MRATNLPPSVDVSTPSAAVRSLSWSSGSVRARSRTQRVGAIVGPCAGHDHVELASVDTGHHLHQLGRGLRLNAETSLSTNSATTSRAVISRRVVALAVDAEPFAGSILD